MKDKPKEPPKLVSLDQVFQDEVEVRNDSIHDCPVHEDHNRLYLFGSKNVPIEVLREAVLGCLRDQCGLDVSYSENTALLRHADRLIWPQHATGVVYEGAAVPENLVLAVYAHGGALGYLGNGQKCSDGNKVEFYALKEEILPHLKTAAKHLRGK